MSSLHIQASERFLDVRFAEPQSLLSWAIVGGGRRTGDRVVWHYVTRAELPEDVDPVALLRGRLRERGTHDAVGLLTARHLRSFVHTQRTQGALRAECIATVGLGNALRTGDPASCGAGPGTINVLCHVNAGLSELALLETLALVVEARTAALLELGWPSMVSGRPASGTGTDCCVVAAPLREGGLIYAGKHTAVGSLVGAAVEAAVGRAAQEWKQEQTSPTPSDAP